MSTVLEEPFNNLTNWTQVGGSGTPAITGGRTGNGLQIPVGAAALAYTIPTPQQSDVITMGFAYRTTALTVSRIVELRSDAGATLHTSLRTSTDGSLNVVRSTTVQLATSAVGVIVPNTWYYLEFQYKLGDSPNGAATVRINNTAVITITGVDTRNAGTKSVYDQVQLQGPAGATTNYDDLYILSGAGETFRGDIHLGGAEAKVWNGTSFVAAPVKVWSGAAFVDAAAVKSWNGSAFV